MSNRKYINEREYTITHCKYDDHGRVIETYEKLYKTNETKTHIYLRPDVLMADCTGTGTRSGEFNGERNGKKVVFEWEDRGYVGEKCPLVKSYLVQYKDDDVKLTIFTMDGKAIVVDDEDLA